MMTFWWSSSQKYHKHGLETRNERDKELDGLATLEYHSRLTQFVRGATRHWVKDSTTVVDFRPLYAITIHNLQRQLAQEIKAVTEDEISDTQLENIRKTLKRYTNALRDFEFIHANRWHTYFVKNIAASRIDDGPGSRLQSALISELGLNLPAPQQTIYSDEDILGSFDHSLMQHSQALGRTRGSERQRNEVAQKRQENFQLAWRRFVFAIVGGLAIIVPILILVIHTVELKTILVVCASICLFALGVASFSSAAPENLLAATAAYAGVLIVFIGNANLGC